MWNITVEQEWSEFLLLEPRRRNEAKARVAVRGSLEALQALRKLLSEQGR